jgi:hypothetical protein
MEVKASLKKNKIKAATVTAIAIRGKAPMTYDDCRVLVTVIAIANRVPDGPHFLPEEILLPNLRTVDLSATTFENDEVPDPPPGVVYGAFENFKTLEHITLPDSLKRIGARAFFNCIKLKSVSFPRELKSIGEDAFKYSAFRFPRLVLGVAHVTRGKLLGEIRHSLERERIIAEMVTEIVITGETPMTYDDCRALVSNAPFFTPLHYDDPGILPNLRVVDLRNATFENGVIPDPPPEVPGWKEPVYEGVPLAGILRPLPFPTFGGFTKLEEIFFPDSLKKINYGAFSECPNLKNLKK